MEVGAEGREQEGYSVLRGKYACQVYFGSQYQSILNLQLLSLRCSYYKQERGGSSNWKLISFSLPK